jgi:uncharacterized protein YlxW (UPF0749 family)
MKTQTVTARKIIDDIANHLLRRFIISSIIFLAVTVWVFIDDNDDEFKIYQREFRRMEIKNSEEELQKELEGVEYERAEYEKRLADAQTSFDGKQKELTKAISSLEQITAKFYKANMNFLGHPQ